MVSLPSMWNLQVSKEVQPSHKYISKGISHHHYSVEKVQEMTNRLKINSWLDR